MRGNCDRPDISPGEQNRPVRPTSSEVDREVGSQARPELADRVELSQAGRAKLAAMEATARAKKPEYVAHIRKQIYEGAYNTNEAVDNVARRILASGDL